MQWNLSHLDQVVGFSFLTFSVLWIPFFISMHGIYRVKKVTVPSAMQFIYTSAPAVLSLVIVTTFLGGIFNEIRLLFIFSPSMISIALDYFNRNWIEIKTVMQWKPYQIFVVMLIIGFIFIT